MSGPETLASLSVHAGPGARVRCSTYPDRGPILGIETGRVSLTVLVAGLEMMPSSGVEFARALARETQRFAAECERMHATQTGQAPNAAQAVGDAV